MKKRVRKVRVDFRKNRVQRTRKNNLTRDFNQEDDTHDDSHVATERISGRGELVRRRTIITEVGDDDNDTLSPCSRETLTAGRVVCVQGLKSRVVTDDGAVWECTTRRLLRTMATDQRHVVVAGDRVAIRTICKAVEKTVAAHRGRGTTGGEADQTPRYGAEGVIERIEPRTGILSRTSRGRKHVIVANVDQVVIVASAAEPLFKPNFVDRLLVTIEQASITPIICINKIDIVAPTEIVACVGVWAQLGYRVILASAVSGQGIDELREVLAGRENVVAGQSGVGKSSLLNAIEPSLSLRTGGMTRASKGKHTTTTAELIPLSFGGYVVDTPGVRQFALWDIIAQEIPGLFRDIRCYEPLCHYPNCTHTHEDDCAVKDAVADGDIDLRRYDSFLALCEEMAG
ncbi:MAG: ribosome small subunit-dependent GTPase A [Thermoguttaceae bacterium]